MGHGRVGSETAKYKSSEGACGLGLVRSYLYVFNVFLLIASLILGGLGIWSVLAEVRVLSQITPWHRIWHYFKCETLIV